LKSKKKVPNDAKTDGKISVGSIWCRKIIVSCNGRIEMFSFKVYACLPDLGINKEIQSRKIADHGLVLGVKFCQQRIVPIHMVLRKVIESDSRLQKERPFKEMIRKVQRIARDDLRHV